MKCSNKFMLKHEYANAIRIVLIWMIQYIHYHVILSKRPGTTLAKIMKSSALYRPSRAFRQATQSICEGQMVGALQRHNKIMPMCTCAPDIRQGSIRRLQGQAGLALRGHIPAETACKIII